MYPSYELPKSTVSFSLNAANNGRRNNTGSNIKHCKVSTLERKFTPRNARIVVNVGGRRYEIPEALFVRFPDTILGSAGKEAYYDHVKKEYFFDRDPDIFKNVLNYFRTGKFHVPEEECFDIVLDELRFFNIPLECVLLENCFLDHPDESKIEQAVKRILLDQSCESTQPPKLSPEISQRKSSSFQEKLADFVNKPQSSVAAVIYSYIITLLTILNVALQITETVACDEATTCGEKYKNIFYLLDASCVVVFTGDFIVRYLGSMKRMHFLTSTENVIDILAISPFYIGLVVAQVPCETLCSQDYYLMAVLRILRIFRILKLSKRSGRLKDLSSACSGGMGEMMVFFLMVFLIIILSSTMVYFMEVNEKNTKFTSIPETMWYTTVTLTSLGYGDMVPQTVIGRLTGVLTILVGFLGTSILIPLMQMKFGGIVGRK